MKSALLLLIILFSACTKAGNDTQPVEDNGCIERIIVPVNGHSIDKADIPVVQNLFLNNRIDDSKFRYYHFFHDSVQTYFPPYSKFDIKSVVVEEYTNGLGILNSSLGFQFNNNIFNIKSGTATHGTTLNTTPRLTLVQLRKLFIDDVELFDHKAAQYKDTCLKAEFGYYDLNIGSANASENLIKAWKVTPLSTIYPGEYPIAYYKDENSALIYYDNGIIVFYH